MGVIPTLKLVMRYPATITMASENWAVFAPIDHESFLQLSSEGKSIERHPLTGINSLIHSILIPLTVFLLPKIDCTIVSDAFKLHITAKQMNYIAIVTYCIGWLFGSFWLYHYAKKPFIQGGRVVEIKSLDVYRNEEPCNEDIYIESTHL